MSGRKFMLLTLIFILALIFALARKNFKVFDVEIIGNESFREEVVEGLRRGGLRFELSKDGDVVFSQADGTLRVGERVYHLGWTEEVLRRIRAEAARMGVSDYELVPKMGWVEVFRESASLIARGFSDAFQGFYLVVPVSVMASGSELMVYYPLRDTFEYPGR